VKFISEEGVNNSGKIIFFQERFIWDRPVIITSSDKVYVLEFSLTEKWGIWGINSREGAVCNVTKGVRMICKNKEATFLDFFR